MEADAGVGLGGIIPTLCTSRRDEAAMKDEVAGTAARHPESNFAESLRMSAVKSKKRLINRRWTPTYADGNKTHAFFNA